MNEVTVTLVGRIGQPPILKTGAKGDWTSFTVATNPRWKQGGDYVDGPTSWFDVNANGELAQHAVDSLVKGQQVIVHGTLSIREVPQQDGTKRTFVTVQASAVGPDLRWGTASFTKAGRPVPQQEPHQQQPADVPAPEPQPDRQAALAGTGAWNQGFGAEVETPF